MAPPSNADQPAAAPPSHSEQLNRLNMVLANHNSTLNALRRSTKAGGEPPPDSPSTTTTNATKKPKTTFSALRNSSAASTLPSSTDDAASESAQAADEDEIFTFFSAGVGFAPEGKEVANDARTAATRDLRGKLLGKRAREQKEDAAAARRKKAQRGRMGDDESDDDEGRSGLGKGRKKARKAAVLVAEDER